MSAIPFNIEIEEESDESFRFNYAHNSTGLPMDLTGYRAEMQVRVGYAGLRGPEPVLTFTSEPGGGIVLGGPSGTVDLYVSYEDTRDKWWNQATYTLFLINPNGGRSPLPDVSEGEASPNNLGEGGLDSNG
jgi:hypothetical protein